MGFSVKLSDPRCKFSSSHFLTEHNKCSRLHGHNYLLTLEVEGDLNEQFFVVDFFILKQLLMQMAEELDHAVILPTHSENIKIEEAGSQVKVEVGHKHYEFPKEDVRLLPLKATTAELLAEFIFKRLKPQYEKYKLTVEVAESDGATAIYREH
jgi:6-pyruvoyltetrahydropterin/6-carboxytetrahydropterin synthase